jgi:AcrR family transcriptional regulator
MVAAGKFDTMTIRSIAAELRVSPMSLYRHVRDKDDLLDEVVDHLLAQCWRPRADRREWVAWTKECAERFRVFLVDQPAALHVYLAHPVVSPAAIERMETVLGVLQSAGFGEDAARRAFGTIHTYTIGFAALEASRARSQRRGDREDEVADLLASYTTPRQFAAGLDVLFEGLERQRPGTPR